MVPAVILGSFLQIFATSPDLCAEVHVDAAGEPYTDASGQALARYCEWTGPGAPLLDAEVCCVIDEDGAACVLPEADGGCEIGVRRYCEHGEASVAGVVCYQPFRSACEAGFCVQRPEGVLGGQAHLACCSPGVCQEIDKSQFDNCRENEGTVLWCDDGMTNDDGTITCFD